MPNLTTNYKLKKPLQEEFYDVEVQNANMDIIDSELKKRATLGANGKVLEEQLPNITTIPVTSEVPSDAEIWIDPNEYTLEEEHINDKNNPHNVTLEQIGAAPANGANIVVVSANKTLTVGDIGKFLRIDVAATISVPNLTMGAEIELFRNTSGAVTIVANGVSFAVSGNTGLVKDSLTITDQYASVVLKQIAGSIWSVQGAV